MREWKSNLGPDVQIICLSCDARQRDAGGDGAEGRGANCRKCRGRHAHLDAFYQCDQPGKLMMLGAANQWFASTVGLLALPREEVATVADLLPVLQALPPEVLASATAKGALAGFRGWAGSLTQTDLFGNATDDVLWDAIQALKSGGTHRRRDAVSTDPTDILIPEWLVLTDEEKYTKHSGSADFRAVRRQVPGIAEAARHRGGRGREAQEGQRLRRLHPDRCARSHRRQQERVAPLTRNGRPTWVPATEDRGEGFFLQFDESSCARVGGEGPRARGLGDVPQGPRAQLQAPDQQDSRQHHRSRQPIPGTALLGDPHALAPD